MAESRVLTNIAYTIHNYSNYDIIADETKSIVDVPYYPIQNLVDVSKVINPYTPQVDCYVPFYDQNNTNRLFGLVNRTDARFVFIEFANNARYIHYEFSGNAYPQGRSMYGYTYDGANLYILGGYADSGCMGDLWQYNINSNQWTNLNFSLFENDSNQVPSNRRKANIVATTTEILMFGGETDTLTINTASSSAFIVPLNDVWSFNLQTGTWTNFDPNRILPNRTGHIIYNDASNIKIYVVGGLNDIGVMEPNAIYTVNKITNVVTSTSISAPFVPSATNCCLMVGSTINVFLSNGSVYQWNDTNSQFVLVGTGYAALNPANQYYWKVNSVSTNYGNNVGMGSFNVSVAKLYNASSALQATMSITLPPVGVEMPSINIGNSQTFFYGGMYSYNGTNYFNQGTYIMNNTTLNVTEYTFAGTARPTSRIFPSLAYDSYNGRVWLFGGYDGTKFYNDLWYFDLGLNSWVLVHAQDENLSDNYPAPRQKSGIAFVDQNYLYIIGGYSNANSYNDFWIYNLLSGEWNQIYTTDNIPWGSTYFIFEYKDYLYMFNGQQLYKYFADIKQFRAQPLLINNISTGNINTGNAKTTTDPLYKLIESGSYMNTPVYVTVVSGTMLVQTTMGGAANTYTNYAVSIDLDSKVVLDLTIEFGINENIYWLDNYVGIGTSTMAAYFINVSPLIPLTQNQIPNSYNSRSLSIPTPNSIVFIDPNADSNSTLTYQDSSGSFTIQSEYLPLDKATLIENNKVAFTGLQSQFPDMNFSDTNGMWNQMISTIGEPTTYPITPWFLYSKYESTISTYKGAQAVLYNDITQQLYIVYQNGNTLRYDTKDNTFFTYYTKLWEGAAYGYNKTQNTIYCFGGIRNSRTVYTQDGMASIPVGVSNSSSVTGSTTSTEATHNGLLQFNLNINEMNLNSIVNYQKTTGSTIIDYPVISSYLTGLIRKYIEGYSNNTLPNSLDDVEKQIYLATQPIVDDLSQFDYVLENGVRPAARAFSAFTQIGNKMYMFGGCECYKSDCSFNVSDSPWNTDMPGTMLNAQAVASHLTAPYDSQAEAKKAVYFDMDSMTWVPLTSLSQWRYMASAIPTTDESKIYIVGGYTAADCANPINNITVYDIANDSYEEIKGIPSKFTARALPLLRWLDDDRLLIMYGMYSYFKCVGCDGCTCCTYYHLPRTDAWIYDKKNNIMYESFENIDIDASIVAKDSIYIGDPTDSTAYSLSVAPDIDGNGNLILKALSWDLIKGEIEAIPIKPTTEIINNFSAFTTPTLEGIIDAMTGAVSGNADSITLDSIINYRYTNSNFRFRYTWVEEYGQYSHKFMFVIGEMATSSGITHLEDIAMGYAECQLRFWYVDLELPDANRYLYNITYNYPLPLSPVVVTYDGSRYIYAIYNKYNIWRLDFKSVLNDNSGSYWYQCPPCLNCNFLGESRTNTDTPLDPWNAFFTDPNYLTLISDYGRIARMDTNTFVWYLDKATAPTPPTAGASLTAGSELSSQDMYLYDLGGVSGKVMNIYEKQWDNFFIDMRQTSNVATSFPQVIEKKLWPTFLRRQRMYIMNQLGHIFYTWLRIDGIYDVDFELQDFYQGDEIRIYGDYTLIQNVSNLIVQVFGINSGWVTLNTLAYSSVINQISWDWDSDYTRRYVYQFIDQNGNTAYNYSTLPPNYVSINLAAGMGTTEPISNIRVTYRNVPSPSNYVSHINQVQLISDQTIVDSYSTQLSTTPLSIINIQPLVVSDSYSNQFAVFIKNDGDHPATNVVVYMLGNTWLQFNANPTTTPNAWSINDENTPFPVALSIDPGSYAIVYIRAVNIDSNPHTADLVVKGIYAFE